MINYFPSDQTYSLRSIHICFKYQDITCLESYHVLHPDVGYCCLSYNRGLNDFWATRTYALSLSISVSKHRFLNWLPVEPVTRNVTVRYLDSTTSYLLPKYWKSWALLIRILFGSLNPSPDRQTHNLFSVLENWWYT